MKTTRRNSASAVGSIAVGCGRKGAEKSVARLAGTLPSGIAVIPAVNRIESKNSYVAKNAGNSRRFTGWPHEQSGYTEAT